MCRSYHNLWSYKGLWEIRKIKAEARLAEAKVKAEIFTSREQKSSLSEVSDFPEFKPVSRNTWLLYIALAILNALVLVFVEIDEPLTTRNVVLIALNFFATAWSLATPIFLTLLKTTAHAQKVHLWLGRYFLMQQFALTKNQFDFTKDRFQNQFDFTAKMVKCVEEIFKTMLDHKELITHKDLLEQIGKQLDEINRLVTEQKIDHEGTSDSSPTK